MGAGHCGQGGRCEAGRVGASEFRFARVEFGVFLRHPRRQAWEALGLVGLELGGEPGP